MDEDKPKALEATEEHNSEADKPAAESAVVGRARKGLSKPVVIGLVIAVLLGAGALGYWMFAKDDSASPSASTSTIESSEESSEETTSTLPAGFVQFTDADASVSFAYPEAWGTATLKPGEEERMDHLTAGSQKIITFSKNDTVVAGIMSTDWEHDPDMGHGGVGEPGRKTLAQAKEAKDNTNPANIYVDTDTEFAYVTYSCTDNCSNDVKTQVQYTMTIPSNATYDVIQFYQDGDQLGDEYMTDDGTVDYEKLDDADLSMLFKKTDPRFTTLQQIAATVRL